MIHNSSNINKTNTPLSSQITELKGHQHAMLEMRIHSDLGQTQINVREYRKVESK
jgi:hypothetical protein